MQQVRVVSHEDLIFVVPQEFDWGLYEELKNCKCVYHDDDKFFFHRNNEHNRKILQEIADFYGGGGDPMTKGQRRLCERLKSEFDDLEFKRSGDYLVVVNKFNLVDTKKELPEHKLIYHKTVNGVRDYFKLPFVGMGTEINLRPRGPETPSAPLW